MGMTIGSEVWPSLVGLLNKCSTDVVTSAHLLEITQLPAAPLHPSGDIPLTSSPATLSEWMITQEDERRMPALLLING